MSYNRSPSAYELSISALIFMWKVILLSNNRPSSVTPFLLTSMVTVYLHIKYNCCRQKGSFGAFKC